MAFRRYACIVLDMTTSRAYRIAITLSLAVISVAVGALLGFVIASVNNSKGIEQAAPTASIAQPSKAVEKHSAPESSKTVEQPKPSASAPAAEPCEPFVITDDTPQSEVDAKLAQGWYSDPTDEMEALYPPSCKS